MDVLFYVFVVAVYGGIGLWRAQSRWDKWDEGNLKNGDESWKSLPDFPISALHGNVGKTGASNLETYFFGPLIQARLAGDKTEEQLRQIERDCRMKYSFAVAFLWPVLSGFGLALLPFTVPLKFMELLREPKRRERRKRFLRAAEWRETPAAEVAQVAEEHKQLGGRVARLEALIEVDGSLKVQEPPSLQAMPSPSPHLVVVPSSKTVPVDAAATTETDGQKNNSEANRLARVHMAKATEALSESRIALSASRGSATAGDDLESNLLALSAGKPDDK